MIRIVAANAMPASRQTLRNHLVHAGHEVQVVDDYPDLRVTLVRFAPHLLVLDDGLPGCEPLKLVAELRQQQPKLGIVLLTHHALPVDRLASYRHGADHVLPHPVLIDELVLVVRNLARHLQPEALRSWHLSLSALTLTDPNGARCPLTPSEAAVLQAIAQAANHQCERPKLAEALGEDWRSFDERRLEALMSRLRRKLHQSLGREVPLRTLRGQGYGFVELLTLR